MNKFSIAMLSIICCAQQIHSMKKEAIKTITEKEYRNILDTSKDFNTTERFIDVTSIRWDTEGQFDLKQRVDLLSLKLYNLNLNETGIKDLINQGADPNYQEPVLLYYQSNVVTYHAYNGTEQGLKNMKLFISLGATGIKNSLYPQTPLTAASNRNNTDMIKLLLPLELSKDAPEGGKDTYTKEQRKDIVKGSAFGFRNTEIIKILLDSKLITPNEALKEFVTRRHPNQEILNILDEHNVVCDSKTLNTIRKDAFPHDSWIQFLTEIVTLDNVQDENSKTLTKLYAIQKMLNASIESLEKHKTNMELKRPSSDNKNHPMMIKDAEGYSKSAPIEGEHNTLRELNAANNKLDRISETLTKMLNVEKNKLEKTQKINIEILENNKANEKK